MYILLSPPILQSELCIQSSKLKQTHGLSRDSGSRNALLAPGSPLQAWDGKGRAAGNNRGRPEVGAECGPGTAPIRVSAPCQDGPFRLHPKRRVPGMQRLAGLCASVGLAAAARAPAAPRAPGPRLCLRAATMERPAAGESAPPCAPWGAASAVGRAHPPRSASQATRNPTPLAVGPPLTPRTPW